MTSSNLNEYYLGKKNKINLFLWCNHGYGDNLIMIPVINKILEKYKSAVNIHIGVHEEKAYLFNGIKDIKIHCFKCDERRNVSFQKYAPEGFIPIYVWMAHPYYTTEHEDGSHDPYQWWRLVQIMNSEFIEFNLPLKIDLENKWPEIKLPYRFVPVKHNSVLVENVDCFSNQNEFDLDIVKIADKYQELNFIAMKKPKEDRINIEFYGYRDLVDYQNILKKCKMFIGKGSGPSHLNYLYETEKMPKALFGYKLKERHRYWADNFPYEYYEGTYDSVFNFINSNYKVFDFKKPFAF